jgi:hypothetical protein
MRRRRSGGGRRYLRGGARTTREEHSIMKLGAALTLVGLGLSAAVFGLGTQACSSDTESTSGGAGASAQTGKVWPKEEGSPTSSTEERTFAVNSILLGETDRGGSPSKDAWKKYGYNLDGLITNVVDQKAPDLEKVCKRFEGAKATIHQDGEQGIDNAVGKEILSFISNFTQAPSKLITDAIKKGDFTLLMTVKGLSDEADQTNTDLSGTILVGGDYGADPPAFDDKTDWPYIAEPKVAISGAYINKGEFVNGSEGATVTISLSIGGQVLSLTIRKAIITFKHNPGSKTLENGTIAGLINTDELLTGIASVAGRFSADLCEGKTLESVKDAIRAAADVMSSGVQDPGANCDAISVGIGFTAKQVAKPTKQVEPAQASPDPCAK